jgi:hypothetical protein
MAARVGHDVSQVRIHTDAAASRSATDIGARAYAAGSHVAFRAGEYQPSTPAGRHLLAHELTHVLQQRHSSTAGPLALGDPHSPAEAEAERAAAAGTERPVAGRAEHAAVVRRQPFADAPRRASPATGGPPSLVPEELCKTNPKLSFCQPDRPRALFPAPCTSTNCSAVGNRFDEQPPDLQQVLAASFEDPATWFEQLDSGRRFALSSIFNRLCGFKVWCHVRSVRTVFSGEPPVGDLFSVPGSTPSVHFTTHNGDALLDALMATGRFCQAIGTGASQHPGQSTLREISGSDSLHVSIGPGDQFDVHIDRYSPVVEHPGSSFCPNAPSAAAVGHIGRELVPEKIRKGFSLFGLHIPGPPGVQVFPEDPAPALSAMPQPGTGAPRPSPSLVGITFQGPRSAPRQRGVVPAEPPVLPAELMARIDRAIAEQVAPEALLPSHVLVRGAAERELGNYPDPYEVARALAERMERARRGGAAVVQLDLPSYDARDFGSRKAIAQQIRRMALILRHYLPEGAATVHSVVIVFGSGGAATREAVTLP